MKKYLIKGALALFAGAFLFSCADKETEFVPMAQQKSKAFEDVFKELYGDVDPYQDWGFSSGKVEVDPNDSTQVVEVVDLDANFAVTRAAAFGRAMTRSIDVNGNLWPDYPKLGDTEDEDVKNYVNHTTKWLTDNGKRFYWVYPFNLTNYYVTQVYKGTDTYNNLDGSNIGTGSSHMNYLQIAEKTGAVINSDGSLSQGWFDVNNFNSGNNTDWGGNTLVLNSGTRDFAYHGTEDSKFHNKWIAVDGEDIDPKYKGNWYICFDFEATNDYVKTNIEVKWKKKVSDTQTDDCTENVQLDGLYTIESAYSYGKKVTVDGNEVVVGSAGYEWRVTQYVQGNKCVTPNDVYTDWIIRLVEAKKSTIEYEYPVYEDDEWEQVERGCVFCEDLGVSSREDLDYNDVVFNAIIFKRVSTKRMWQVRYADGEKVDSTEVIGLHTDGLTYPIVSTNYFANVELLAAGGTIPVTIQSNMEGAKAYQVHDEFDAPITMMINTRDNNSTAFGSFEEREPVQLGDIEKNFQAKLPNGKTEDFNVKLFEIDYPNDHQAIKQIKIVSSVGEAQILELKSERADFPRKFMAPYDTKWTSERKNISLAYPLFGQWVKNEVTLEDCFSSANSNPDYLYSGAYSASGLKLPLVMKARRSYVTGIEHDIWSGSKTYGSSWNLENLDTDPVTKEFDKFYPGDRLRFYGTQISDDAWITVVIGNIKPYFVDSEFPNYTLDSKGNKIPLPLEKTSCVEVMLDEYSANLLNNEIKAGILTFQVQGRNFTLTRICRVLFN